MPLNPFFSWTEDRRIEVEFCLRMRDYYIGFNLDRIKKEQKI